LKTQGSLQYSKESDAGRHPEPGASSPHRHNSIYLISILKSSSHQRLCPPGGLLPSGLPTKILYAILPCVLRVPPIIPPCFTYPSNIRRGVQNCGPHQAIFSSLLEAKYSELNGRSHYSNLIRLLTKLFSHTVFICVTTLLQVYKLCRVES